MDIITQILNFGLPAPIDIQVTGNKLDPNREFAEKLLNELKFIPGRGRSKNPAALQLSEVSHRCGPHQRRKSWDSRKEDVATDLLISLSGSFQTSPTFWLDPQTGVSYSVRPKRRNTELRPCRTSKIFRLAAQATRTPQILANVASVSRGGEMASHLPLRHRLL